MRLEFDPVSLQGPIEGCGTVISVHPIVEFSEDGMEVDFCEPVRVISGMLNIDLDMNRVWAHIRTHGLAPEVSGG